MRVEFFSLSLVILLLIFVIVLQLCVLSDLKSYEEGLDGGEGAEKLYDEYLKDERYFLFIFSRDEISDLREAFLEYTVEEDEKNKSRLYAAIANTRRQLMFFV